MEARVLMFEGVLKGVRRMARAFDDEHESRRQWRLGWVWASAAVMGGCWDVRARSSAAA